MVRYSDSSSSVWKSAAQMNQRDEKQPVCFNLVLLGKTGSGKSATGNTMLGRKAFISKKSPTSVTQVAQVEHSTIEGLNVNVYDTPGFFDTELSDEKVQEICQSVFSMSESGPCVFLLVIKADRFTEEERRTVEMIEKLLGQNRLENTWILFTRGDELEEENQTITEFISESPELKKLVQKYQNRYHVFNNKLQTDMFQVRCLLKKICNANIKFSFVLKRRKQVESRNSSAAERRVVLIGKAGAGKSASGNTILGQQCFKSEVGMKAVTKQSAVETGGVAGRKVSVVDTPGLFDADVDPEEWMREIARSVYLSSPGPHALLIALPLTSRFTAQEQEMIQQIKLLFGEKMTKYAVLLFTYGDRLGGKDMEELIKESCALRELVQQCGGRYHVFNNIDRRNTEQVTELLEKIDRMVEQNGGSCYSNQMFEEAERCRREDEERRKREEEEKKQREEEERQKEIETVIKETEERIREEMLRQERTRVEQSSCCIS